MSSRPGAATTTWMGRTSQCPSGSCGGRRGSSWNGTEARGLEVDLDREPDLIRSKSWCCLCQRMNRHGNQAPERNRGRPPHTFPSRGKVPAETAGRDHSRGGARGGQERIADGRVEDRGELGERADSIGRVLNSCCGEGSAVIEHDGLQGGASPGSKTIGRTTHHLPSATRRPSLKTPTRQYTVM